MTKKPIKLKTARATIESSVENNKTLKNSMWFKYLTDEAKKFCYETSKPKTISEGDMLYPARDFNKLYFVMSGEFYILYKNGNEQKLIKSIYPGDFFSMRKDFDYLYVYPKKSSLVFILEQDDLIRTFSLSPQSKEILKDFFIDVASKLKKLMNK